VRSGSVHPPLQPHRGDWLPLQTLPPEPAPPFFPPARGASLESYLLADSVAAQLMDPDLANDAVQFMELQVTLMTCLLLFY
jgi:hypothetical protein